MKKELKSEPNLLMNKTAVGINTQDQHLELKLRKIFFRNMSRFQIMYYFIKKQGDIVNGPFDIGHIQDGSIED